jgi:hypothetical protein
MLRFDVWNNIEFAAITDKNCLFGGVCIATTHLGECIINSASDNEYMYVNHKVSGLVVQQ